MKKILFFVLFYNILVAKTFYAKVEPIYEYNIKASVSGKVVYVDKNSEGRFVKDKTIIKLDTKLDTIELKSSLKKLTTLKRILSLQKEILNSLRSVKSKSKIEKDNQQILVLNTKNQIDDLEYKISALKDKISKKNISIKNRYIYQIYVKEDDFVNPGSLLLKAYDISKAKLIIYPSIDEIDILKKKTIFIDDKKTNLKIDKIYKIEDSKFLTSYRCEIYINNPKQFSKIVKIEFK